MISNTDIFKAHCKDRFPREFAYRPFPWESNLSIRRIRPVKDFEALVTLAATLSTRKGLYVSVYSYTDCPNSCVYESAVIDRIFLDFDSKQDPGAAIEEASDMLRLLSDIGIYATTYFSGGKGAACYIDFPPVDIAPKNKKDTLGLFWDHVHEGLGRTFHYLDGGSVRGDIARVSRLPNTKHESGFYCIPLENSDLEKGLSHIHSLARSTCHDIDLQLTIDQNTKANRTVVPQLLRKLEAMAESQREEKEKKALDRKIERMCRKPSRRKGHVDRSDIRKAKAVPISDLIGREKMIVCPFHTDTVRSLSISHEKGLWHCFGCGRGGDVIALVMEMEGLDFLGAVRRLSCSR
ncbi:MAG: CHC2 zinc finger domain-containing protein [Candidatus Methanoperedens sp.]|nr:CHC2 zinc finger domain-containing protein [Candidatus Methanoperedens sp.]